MNSTTIFIACSLAAVIIIAIFNSLISKKNQVEFAFASIDAQFKKRYDLIPNLVSACEKYMGYEDTLLKEITATRTKALSSGSEERVELDGKISNQLRSVFALAENYPNLKAVDTFTMLQRSLNEVEEQLSAARRAYNATVTVYNNACQMFPTSLFAALMGYRTKSWFQATESEREPIKVWR
jgi:LemA protein